MKPRLFWLLIIPLYYYGAFSIMWSYGGPSADGYGYMPGLTLPGFRPTFVSLSEYEASWSVRLLYRLPHFVYALPLTLLGCVGPAWLVQRSARLARHPFGASFILALVFLVLGAIANDVASELDLWRMPIWFGWDFDVYWVRHFLFILLPLSLASGMASLNARRLAR